MTTRYKCPMRHENGNCLPHGGFCTAVQSEVCKAMRHAFDFGVSDALYRVSLGSAAERVNTLSAVVTGTSAAICPIQNTPTASYATKTHWPEEDMRSTNESAHL